MNNVGITGTREGVTGYQISSLAYVLMDLRATELRHGDCKGADEQSHYLARALRLAIVIHPPDNIRFRAYCGVKKLSGFQLEVCEPNVTLLPTDEYHARDRAIVDNIRYQVAMPKSNVDLGDGGTAYTANYARRMDKPLALIWPSGRVEYERWTYSEV